MPTDEYYKKWLAYFDSHPEEAKAKAKWIAKAKAALAGNREEKAPRERKQSSKRKSESGEKPRPAALLDELVACGSEIDKLPGIGSVVVYSKRRNEIVVGVDTGSLKSSEVAAIVRKHAFEMRGTKYATKYEFVVARGIELDGETAVYYKTKTDPIERFVQLKKATITGLAAGFKDEKRAKAFAAHMKERGYDTSVMFMQKWTNRFVYEENLYGVEAQLKKPAKLTRDALQRIALHTKAHEGFMSASGLEVAAEGEEELLMLDSFKQREVEQVIKEELKRRAK